MSDFDVVVVGTGSSGRSVVEVCGPRTEELVNIFSLAIRAKIPAATLAQTLFAYPSASSDIEPTLES